MKSDTHPDLIERAMQRADALRHAEIGADEVFQWLAESPRNVEEFLFAQETLDQIAELTPLEQSQLIAMDEEQEGVSVSNVIPLNPTRKRRRPISRFSRSVTRVVRRKYALAALAAAFALAFVCTAWWQHSQWQSYSTVLGEQRSVDLPDGSTILLNTASVVKVHFTKTARELELTAGEALFDVHHDPHRPFRVVTEGAVVQALGTQFDVYRRAHDVKVAVIEGAVRVSQNEGSAPIQVSAGNLVQVDPQKGVQAPVTLDGTATAWRQKRLIFTGNSLQEIADEFNRYNRSPRIEILDEAAAAQRFAGTFNANAPEALMQALALNQAVQVTESDGKIMIGTRR